MYARRFPCGRWSFSGPGSEEKWYKTCPDIRDGNWDRTAEMMILRLHTGSSHPIFRASSAFETGDLENKEHGKKSTQFNDNAENNELLLRTVISVNQDFSEDSECVGLFDTEDGPNKIFFCRVYIYIYVNFIMPPNARCSLGGNAAISETDTSRTSTTSTTRSAIRRRRKLRLLYRSENWMAVLQPRGNPQAASSSSTSQWSTSQWQTSWESWQPTLFEKSVVISVSLEGIPENRRGV